MRYDLRKAAPDYYDWYDVRFILSMSLLSWLSFTAVLISILEKKNFNIIGRIKARFPNPPKWM